MGLGVLLLSVALSGISKILMFIHLPSILIVFGGAIASVMVAYPLDDVLKTFHYVRIAFFNQKSDPMVAIDQIVSLAETARREGLLALENRIEDIKEDPFLADGIRMAIDGLAPDVIENAMNVEIDAINARHQYYRSILNNVGKYAPVFGMMGTVVGLVLMLADFDPEQVGSGMAVALLTTFYGAIFANLFVLPMADKLGFLNEFELQVKDITLKGIIAIQTGENPRVIKHKLLKYISPNRRPMEEEVAAA